MLVFGLDIGTTSIGFAVVELKEPGAQGKILRLGSRIFPEARDPDGTPLNQQRRAKRMARRQLRRRKQRRRALNESLADTGFLPSYSSEEWTAVMAADPYYLRKSGLTVPLEPYQLGRTLYHLAKRRHFKGRDLDDNEANAEQTAAKEKEEQEAKTGSDATHKILKAENKTLGAWLADKEKKRSIHATREDVRDEFEKLWSAQAAYHPALKEPSFKAQIETAIFAQRPVFWRKNTLGQCRLEPGAELCPKGSWLSQQRRMLEKLNNLAIAGGNGRPLEPDERQAILAELQTQGSMSWSKVRKALEPLFKVRDESAKNIKFNLEIGDEKGGLLGNPLEAKLAHIFGAKWANHPYKGKIHREVHATLWVADYGEISTQRVVIRSETERKEKRNTARESFVRDFGASEAEADELAKLKLPTGWEPFSNAALEKILPELEKGVRFGALLTGPEWEEWRLKNFPNREQPTGEICDKLPSPTKKHPEELQRVAQLRNPTVVRTQNELRKVVNNLIGMFGKPDLIRIELARAIGKSKRERDEIQNANREQERRRKEADRDLKSNGIVQPSHDDIEKWLLWKECREQCPYSGEKICFDDLFRNGLFEVEHIWPRPVSLDNGFTNKTLCHRDWNKRKAKRMPFEAFGHTDDWQAIKDRLDRMMKDKKDKKDMGGMPPKKVRRFLVEKMPDDFTNRQLTDTSYAARQALAYLKKLWPDVGPEAPVTVQAVSGRVTAQLRKRWGLNNILADDGEKTRADHRHHAVDALTVACANPAYVKRLSDYYKDEERGHKPLLPEPWTTIRQDATAAVEKIIVSHRVRRKVSGPLHKETTYGDTKLDEKTKTGIYRVFVTRKKVDALTKSELDDIRDNHVREIVKAWVADHGGEPKKAFATYPRLTENGPEIRKVRLTIKQQSKLMAPASTGYVDLGANHHIAIYRLPNGKADYEIVSLFEAARRLSRREPIVRRNRDEGAQFVMSLTAGDTIEFPENHEKKGYRIVQGVWASGVVVTLAHTDATGATVWRPSASSLLGNDARKISIDPIGRVRPAND